MKIKKPKFWDQNYFTVLSLLFFPLTLLYSIITKIRKIFSKPKKFPIGIICVGNIYVGGTGKTPLSIEIIKILNNLNYKTCFIKKKYPNQLDEHGEEEPR